jgi:hypothetical protein
MTRQRGHRMSLSKSTDSILQHLLGSTVACLIAGATGRVRLSVGLGLIASCAGAVCTAVGSGRFSRRSRRKSSLPYETILRLDEQTIQASLRSPQLVLRARRAAWAGLHFPRKISNERLCFESMARFSRLFRPAWRSMDPRHGERVQDSEREMMLQVVTRRGRFKRLGG